MILTQASWDIVPAILKVLERHWPESRAAFYTLSGYSELRVKFPETECLLLTPDGQADNFGTFVLIFQFQFFEFFATTFNPDWKPLVSGLMNSPDIDWTKDVTWGPCESRLFPVAFQLSKSMDLNISDLCEAQAYSMSNAEARAVEFIVPNDVYLDNLQERHGALVNRLWPHAVGEETLKTIKDYIKHRRSVGLFRKDTKELVAWCVHLEYGGPGLLHVLPEERGKGYGETAVRAITKHLGKLGLEPIAFIVKDNHGSKRLFTKIGYKEGNDAAWFTFSPNNEC